MVPVSLPVRNPPWRKFREEIIANRTRNDLSKARDRAHILIGLAIAVSNVDKIIVITHWGSEYRSFPDKYQKKWGEWLLSNGADIVIGGHPHWVQPAEYRKDSLNNEKLIIWSLGNVISNQRREHTDGGSSLQFSLYRDSTGEVKFKDIGYHLHWVWLHNKDSLTRYQILPISKSEKLILEMDEKSKKELNQFIDNERSLYIENNIDIPEFQYNVKSDSYYLE